MTNTLFTTIWTEDTEIEFLELAKEGIPEAFKSPDGTPRDCPQVNAYLQDLYKKNLPRLLAWCSERFHDLWKDNQ